MLIKMGIINRRRRFGRLQKSAPDVFMGLTSQLSYKNWDLSFALRASIGNYAYNNVQSNREAWDGSQMYDQTGFLKIV